jgi:hypothetical protein
MIKRPSKSKRTVVLTEQSFDLADGMLHIARAGKEKDVTLAGAICMLAEIGALALQHCNWRYINEDGKITEHGPHGSQAPTLEWGVARSARLVVRAKAPSRRAARVAEAAE